MRDADGDALTLAVAENVIRADLARSRRRAYERVAEHGDSGEGGEARRPQREARSASGSTSCAYPTKRKRCSPPGGCRSPARPR